MANPFPNDGSFLERFKQLQQGVPSEPARTSPLVSMTIKSSRPSSNSKGAAPSRSGSISKGSLPNGKLAFSLKQKSKLAVNPIKLGEDEDDGNHADAHRQSKRSRTDTAPRTSTPEPKDSGGFPSCLLYLDHVDLFRALNS